tara:strand:+ start:415 stop:672 length:258 start_codon:yes stop_codon:yes gene_type:complete
MSKQLIRNYNRIYSKKGSVRFHHIPYHLQYESRDFNKEIIKPSEKVLMNREKYIKEFNPYLKSNVSENLDEKILKFYRERYLTRW